MFFTKLEQAICLLYNYYSQNTDQIDKKLLFNYK